MVPPIIVKRAARLLSQGKSWEYISNNTGFSIADLRAAIEPHEDPPAGPLVAPSGWIYEIAVNHDLHARFLAEAERRSVSVPELLATLLGNVVVDDLFAAVLDVEEDDDA